MIVSQKVRNITIHLSEYEIKMNYSTASLIFWSKVESYNVTSVLTLLEIKHVYIKLRESRIYLESLYIRWRTPVSKLANLINDMIKTFQIYENHKIARLQPENYVSSKGVRPQPMSKILEDRISQRYVRIKSMKHIPVRQNFRLYHLRGKS